ncbi:MAG: prohibitin family protein [Campylobacteraceae bacterium]|nr:prohibitin family protein [Campylobacteraceae bacterium]
MPADLNDYFNKKRGGGDNNRGGGPNMPNIDFKMPEFKGFGKSTPFIYAGLALVVLLVLFQPWVTISSGQVGIRTTFKRYDVEPLQPGFHFFIPGIQKVFIVDTRVRLINYTDKQDASVVTPGVRSEGTGIIRKNSLSVLDARNLPVNVDITIQYNLNQTTAPTTIAKWGFSWEDKIIDPVVEDVVRSVIGRYTAEEIPTNRNGIAKQIDDDIRKRIESIENMPVDLRAVQLREIILPDRVKEQIERVQIAKQEAERAKYEVERANQEALKRAALAEGTAQATIIEAQGRADATRVEADAMAYANKEIAKSLDNNILQMKQIETQAKFNEALRENKDAKIFLTPGGAVPNIWVDTKDPQKQSAINQ